MAYIESIKKDNDTVVDFKRYLAYDPKVIDRLL
jgi:hypothetical protein